jgi:pyocin large subunit-like protein
LKHGSEFPELRNAGEYVRAAHELREAATRNPLSYYSGTRADGAFLVYHPGSNTFASYRGTTPATMFRPSDGIAYFFRQL